MEAAGTGTSVFWHLRRSRARCWWCRGEAQAESVVAVAEPDVNIGLCVSTLRAAESVV